MLKRALIVLLLVLNVGVAAVWASRPLLRHRRRSDSPSAWSGCNCWVNPAIASHPAKPPAARLRRMRPCQKLPWWRSLHSRTFVRFWPIPGQPGAICWRRPNLLRPGVANMRVRETQAGSSRGWHVFLPPLADRASAQAMAERIVAAGFKIITSYPTALSPTGIELGRYGNEAAASRRRDTCKRPVSRQPPNRWEEPQTALDRCHGSHRIRPGGHARTDPRRAGRSAGLHHAAIPRSTGELECPAFVPARRRQRQPDNANVHAGIAHVVEQPPCKR